jgi:uncharacterized membrane protein
MSIHDPQPTAQSDIDRAEWANPANWSDSAIGFYFSKKDSRILVPKRNPALGWTLNLAHGAGAAWLLVSMLAPSLVLALIVVLVATHRC